MNALPSKILNIATEIQTTGCDLYPKVCISTGNSILFYLPSFGGGILIYPVDCLFVVSFLSNM
jgi:hypothetical protein